MHRASTSAHPARVAGLLIVAVASPASVIVSSFHFFAIHVLELGQLPQMYVSQVMGSYEPFLFFESQDVGDVIFFD